MDAKRPTRRVFLVVSSVWSYNDEFYDGDETPVRAFSDLGKAEAYRAYCEARALGDADQYMGSESEASYKVIEAEVEV